MPRLVGLFGRSWLLGSDDFAFICPGSAIVHLAWAAVGSCSAARVGAWNSGVSQKLCACATAACVATAFWDIVVAWYASRGAILAQDRRALVPDLLRVRLLLGAAVTAIAVVASVGVALPLEEAGDAPPALGWGEDWQPSAKVCDHFFVGLLCTQLLWHGVMATFGILVSKDAVSCGSSGGVTDVSVRTALRWLGASDGVIQDVAEVLMRLLGDADLTPSDIIFGLLLVGAAQSREERATPVAAPLLSTEDCEDQAALKELVHFVPFANGIYGCPMQILGEAALPGTSIPGIRQLACACCRAIPCLQRTPQGASGAWCCCPPVGPVEGDNCFRSAGYSLRRAVARQGSEVELLLATWVDRGLGTAPPFAILCDHASSELVIVIRGSLSFKDIIIDVSCKNEPYDPFNFQEQGERERSEGNADRFVHAGMLACMRDIKTELTKRGTLEEALAPGGSAHGYKIVCTGHSLGAGIAVLLALELHATHGDSVRYVGFEPPPCLSPALARETQRLGWYSSILEQDWISRLSLRSLQQLRESVMDELFLCQQTKFQLAMQFSTQLLIFNWSWWQCVRRLAASLCAQLSGKLRLLRRRRPDSESDLGTELAAQEQIPPGTSPPSSETLRAMESRRAQRNEPDFFAEQMSCPGQLVVLRPTVSERILCGWWSRDVAWVAQWGTPEQFREMIVTPRAVEYHFPHIVASALTAALHDLGNFSALRLLDPASDARDFVPSV